MFDYVEKVKLNYEFYKGSDEYSDGDIEDEMLEIAKSCSSQEDIDKLLRSDDRWPILYHFSDIRHNILNWYDFDKDSSVLEIGAGCGAVTGLFCERCGKVTSVDLSKRRSMINAYRNRAYDNLEIIVGNFEDIEFTEKYDYISLIGVLEYSIYYIGTDDPFNDMLRKVRALLKPQGKLLIAIENKYGLKYWLGACEDHTGRIFDGIEGYRDVDKVRTFSKDTLDRMLLDVGFCKNEFYYPMPDYKMPLRIYADDTLPTDDDIIGISPSYDRDRVTFMDEANVWKSVCDDNMFGFFANSFLIISHNDARDQDMDIRIDNAALNKCDFLSQYEKNYHELDMNHYHNEVDELKQIIAQKDETINAQNIYIKKLRRMIKNPVYGLSVATKKLGSGIKEKINGKKH